MGAEVAVCGPKSLLPHAIDGVRRHGLPARGRGDRVGAGAQHSAPAARAHDGGYIPSLREYNRVFGVTRERLDRAKRDVLILHPGPMNRGVEIDSDVADGPHSVILNQVTNGVAVRMAVLYLLAGGKPELAEAAKGASGGDR